VALALSSLRVARAVGLVVCAVGLFGFYRYIDNFRLFRGYPPPREPSFVSLRGRAQAIEVASPALGGRRQRVVVYLPPGYSDRPDARYAVLYLLHGVPGQPDQFLRVVRAGVIDDTLVAEARARPLIVVMPSGSTGLFTDKEWANGVRPGEGWETFVARDLVRAIDRRYRTLPRGSGRAIGGLSEGGYGALNIALHHPGEFRVIESWSGYQQAPDMRAIFGRSRARLDYNSPLLRLSHVARRLRAAGTYIWFYSGRNDPLRRQNDAFAAALSRAQVRYRYMVLRGRHDWRLWRGQAESAFLAAAHHLAGAGLGSS
jgi:S-formylglutathione hydrolase FrmB